MKKNSGHIISQKLFTIPSNWGNANQNSFDTHLYYSENAKDRSTKLTTTAECEVNVWGM